MDGFFRITFTGTAGSGFGVLVFHKGIIAGADVAGATFDGSYTEDPTAKQLDFHVTMNAPAGVTPVQTGVPIAAPMSLPINGTILEDHIAGGKPALLQTSLGPVNILFQKIRDFP
jgi:hypothetical protein